MIDMHLGRSREKTVALIDVQEGGASAAIATLAHAGTHMHALGSSALSLEARTPEQVKAQIGAQVEEALAAALQGYRGATVEQVYVIVHAPLSETRTIVTATQFEQDVKIQDVMVATMARDALVAEKLDRSRLLEGSVIRVELNGYPTHAPAGQRAHQLEVTSLVSEWDPELRTTIEHAVRQHFPGATLLWRSAIRALMAFAQEGSHLGSHYCIIDMGIDATQIISVRGEAFAQRVIPEGIRSILARVGAGKSAEQILSSIRMLERESASGDAAEALKRQMATAEQELVKAFAEPIGELAKTRRACNNLLLVTHPDLEPWLSRFFSRIDFAQFTMTTLPFTVTTPRALSAEVAGFSPESPLVVDLALVNTEISAV